MLFDVLGVEGVHILRYLLVEGVVVTVAIEGLTILTIFLLLVLNGWFRRNVCGVWRSLNIVQGVLDIVVKCCSFMTVNFNCILTMIIQ